MNLCLAGPAFSTEREITAATPRGAGDPGVFKAENMTGCTVCVNN